MIGRVRHAHHLAIVAHYPQHYPFNMQTSWEGIMRSVRDFGAVGDGEVDDSKAIQHAVDSKANEIVFPPGDYRITQSIVLDESKSGRVCLSGSGGTAKILMEGAGPAFRIIGTHNGSADPGGFEAGVWQKERMPTILNIEIEGKHPEADGIHIERTMQSTFEGVLLRELRHGIHVQTRARNVLISHCHIYHNRGIGVFFDHVNLHQVIIASSHISYNAQSGIKILNGEMRNVQITGNDIEYNYDKSGGEDVAPSAEIWIECSDESASMREGTIASNTIQARHSPGGANIMLIGSEVKTKAGVGMLAISGNLIGSQETNVLLDQCDGVTLTGNFIYSGHKRNLHVKNSRNIVVSGNCFNHNRDYLPNALATGITFEDSTDCIFSGSAIRDSFEGKHTASTPVVIEREGSIEVLRCARFSLNGSQITDPGVPGLRIADSSFVNISACTIADSRDEKLMPSAIRWTGPGTANSIRDCTIGAGTETALAIDDAAGVAVENNTMA